MTGSLDGMMGTETEVRLAYYDIEAGRPKHWVGLMGGTHWGYTDSIVESGNRSGDPGPPDVLLDRDATVAQQQAAQRTLAARFLVAFFRKYLLHRNVPDDLDLDRAIAAVPGAREPEVAWDT